MILSPAEMLETERRAFAGGISAAGLMEKAGLEMANLVRHFHPFPGNCLVFFGKGHNGGDVLVAARHLAEWGWGIELEQVSADLAPLTAKNLTAISQQPASSPYPLVILDGLLGIGVSGDPREPIATAIQRINHLRGTRAAWVLSADLPSGLREDMVGNPCVVADATITMGFAKTSLVADHATNFVGRLAVAELTGLEAPLDADPSEILSHENLRHLLPPRSFDIHKGQCGRVGIIAGSSAFPGAARLCSAAAVKSGAGLVTLFAPPEVTPILAASVLPEVMVSSISDFRELLGKPFDVFAIGPGLDRERDALARDFVQKCPAPCVVDADALNVFSNHTTLLRSCAGPRLLTPHPLEMDRLDAKNNRTRRQWLSDFVEQYPVALLLKGARTIIGQKGFAPAYNSTGHPGMASGGMGDVLTGVCAGLMAQGKTPFDAAKLAAWTCGYAAELAIRDSGCSQESLTASDVIHHLGPAFNCLRHG